MRIFKLHRKNEFKDEFYSYQLNLFNLLNNDIYNNIVIQQDRQIGITYLLSKYVKSLIDNNDNLKILFVLPHSYLNLNIKYLIGDENILNYTTSKIIYNNQTSVSFCTPKNFLNKITGNRYNVIIVENFDHYDSNDFNEITSTIPSCIDTSSNIRKIILTCNEIQSNFLINTIIKESNDNNSNCLYRNVLSN